MALPGSGTMSGTDVATEFSATLPKSATDFYRGGTYVPDTGGNAAVPTSGTMLGSNLYGASASDSVPDAVSWSDITTFGANGTNFNQTITGINVTITIKITWDGTAGTFYYRKNSGSYTAIGSGGTFTVVNGDTVNFRVLNAGSSGNVSVLNNTNGDALIDSFIYV